MSLNAINPSRQTLSLMIYIQPGNEIRHVKVKPMQSCSPFRIHPWETKRVYGISAYRMQKTERPCPLLVHPTGITTSHFCDLAFISVLRLKLETSFININHIRRIFSKYAVRIFQWPISFPLEQISWTVCFVWCWRCRFHPQTKSLFCTNNLRSAVWWFDWVHIVNVCSHFIDDGLRAEEPEECEIK